MSEPNELRTITFYVSGVPAPGGSKKHIGNGRMIDMCKRNSTWRHDVGWAAKLAMDGAPFMDGPLCMQIQFRMPRPKHHFRTGKHAGKLKDDAPDWHTCKPDDTKLTRSTEDAMTNIVWADDATIARQEIEKIYHDRPGAMITVFQMDRKRSKA